MLAESDMIIAHQIIQKFTAKSGGTPGYLKQLLPFEKNTRELSLAVELNGRAPDSVVGRLIFYCVKEYTWNVASGVYDAPFVVENGEMVMQTDLNMNGKRLQGILYTSDDYADDATNVFYVKDMGNTAKTDLQTQLNTAKTDLQMKFQKYVDRSYLAPSGQQRDAFRYLMEDIDESLSENNITITGIVSWDESIHQINKNVYRFILAKDVGSNNYRSRIGFNPGPLPIGYYTFVCEFFPIVMSNVSITAQATTISINGHSISSLE